MHKKIINHCNLDIDAVTDKKGIQKTKKILISQGFNCRKTEWGFQLYTAYEPSFSLTDQEQKLLLPEIRIEVSEPRITEYQTDHYFEFSLTHYQTKKIHFHTLDKTLLINVPIIADLTAVKLGLPADYKNIFDAIVLLQQANLSDVVTAIKKNDSWDEMVLRRLPKYQGRLHDKNSLVHRIAIDADIDIKNNIKKLSEIQNILRKTK